MAEIEDRRLRAPSARRCRRAKLKPMRIRPRKFTPLSEIFKTLFVTYRKRALCRPRIDGRAGLLLQRDIFHLRACFDAILRRSGDMTSAGISCLSRSAMLLGPLILGPLFDFDRPQADDRVHLRRIRPAARRQRLAVRP